MSITFPSSLDSFTNPQATDVTGVVDHALQHRNANDAIEALEAKVGADSSTSTTSLDYKSGIKPYVIVGSSYADYITDGTADDVQIQAAINSLTSGGTVFIKQGTYKIAAKVTIPSNVTILGSGWATILYSENASNITLLENSDTTSGNSNIIVRDLQINMNRANNTTATNIGAIKLWSCSDSKIENLYIHDMKYAQGTGNVGIGLANCTDCVVQNNYINTVSDYGIATDSLLRCLISKNVIVDPAGHGIGVQYSASYSNGRPSHNKIDGNIVFYTSSGLSAVNGIKVQRADYCSFTNNTLWCTNGDGGRGITTTDSGTNTDYETGLEYLGNIIYGFATAGIYSRGALQNIYSSNQIVCPDSANGIHIRQSTGTGTPNSYKCTVSSNSITFSATNNGGIGLVFDSGDSFVVAGNSIEYANVGVYTVGGVNHCAITGNEIKNSQRSAINLGVGGDAAGSLYCSVTGNTIQNSSIINNNTSDGITLSQASSYNSVTGNIITQAAANKARYGISEDTASCDYNVFTGNIIKDVVNGVKIRVQGANSEQGHNIEV